MELTAEGVVSEVTSSPLNITATMRKTMVAKAKALLTEKMSEKELMDKLEQFYVATNKHYTSAQLKDIIGQVVIDLTPEPVEELSL